MTDMQAALLSSQFDKLDMFSERRKELVKRYDEAFADIPEIVIQKEIAESDTVRHLVSRPYRYLDYSLEFL